MIMVQTKRGSLASYEAKNTAIDKKITCENKKLNTAENDTDLGSDNVKVIKNRMKGLLDKKAANLELVKAKRAKAWTQFTSFCEMLDTMMNEDKTLGERIKTLLPLFLFISNRPSDYNDSWMG